MPTASQIRPSRGDELELTIDSLAHGGNGVARLEGYVVFVAGAVPGDRVRTESGRAEILFGDGSLVQLDEQTSLDLLSDARLRLLSGRIALVTTTAQAGRLQRGEHHWTVDARIPKRGRLQAPRQPAPELAKIHGNAIAGKLHSQRVDQLQQLNAGGIGREPFPRNPPPGKMPKLIRVPWPPVPVGTQEGKRMASGHTGNVVPGNRLRVRVPCPPLF